MSSDKKKSKRRKDEYTGPGGNEEVADKSPPKDEFKVAKWMKKNIPTKKTKFLNHNVEYFTASKALDALLTTTFAQGDKALFVTREDVIQYLDSMLVHKFFHRAKKVPVSEAELRRGKKTKEQQQQPEEPAAAEDAELRKRTKTTTATEKDGGSEADVNKSPKTPSGGSAEAAAEKKKRKIRLDMHPDQQFVDGAEAYIWIYDPIPVHYWLFGALLVVGAIVVCLFPLWPPTLRLGVYYLSIAAAGFLVFILSLAVIRFIVFCVVWALTGSKHHLWLFPNLTEDVGFFASFWPLYQHDYVDGSDAGGSAKGGKSKARKAVKKDKLSDGEDEEPLRAAAASATPKAKAKAAAVATATAAAATTDGGASSVDTEQDEDEPENIGRRSHSDSESECSQKSSTGKDFEMVNPDEVEMS